MTRTDDVALEFWADLLYNAMVERHLRFTKCNKQNLSIEIDIDDVINLKNCIKFYYVDSVADRYRDYNRKTEWSQIVKAAFERYEVYIIMSK